MRPLTLLLLLSALVACGSKDDDDDDDDDGGSDAGDDTGTTGDGGWMGDGGSGDGGSGDGGSGDGGSGGDGGSSSSGPCPDYMGLGGVGSFREYETTASYESAYDITGGYRLEVISVSGGTLTAEMESDYVYADGGRALTTALYTYECTSAGAAMTRYEAEGSYSGSGYSYTWTQDTVYTDSYLAVVPGISTGTEWSDSWAYTSTMWTSAGGSSTTSGSGTTRYEAGAESTTTTPAGTFTVRRFDASTTVSGSTSASSWYSDRDLGTVKSDFYELVDYRD